ncbi:MAG TPA: DUF6241 domain-containing protein [Chondromyces sp.]|nr:DUF6241 domain-containing protein [Chondromyces sp.]
MKAKKDKNKLSKAGIVALAIVFIALSLVVFAAVSSITRENEQNGIAEQFNESRLDMKNPFAEGKTPEELFKENMTEEEVQIAIHHMSHQKIKAKRKWGALQITPERIDRLIEVVEINESKHEQSAVYLSILNRWKKGDFSKVDKDHNAIWRLQGGTIGKATGLLSAKEEEKYIKQNFKR